MTTWILVADGWHARVFAQAVPGGRLADVTPAGLEHQDARGFSRERGDDRPGRAFDPGSGSPHAMEPRVDPHQREERRFATQVARVLEAAAERRAYEKLVLVAPPRMLGDLRAEIGDGVRKRVVGEAHKELMKLPAAELERHVAEIVEGLRLPS